MENENEPELTGKQYLVCMLLSILIVRFLAYYTDSPRKDSDIDYKAECSWECQGLLSRINKKNYSRIPLFCNVSRIRNFQIGTIYISFRSCFNISKKVSVK